MNILELIVQNPNTSNYILAKIAKIAMWHNNVRLLQKISLHPHASSSTFAMANSYIEKCKRSIIEQHIRFLKIYVENPMITDDILKAIAMFAIVHNNEELIKKVSNHPFVSASTLEMIAKHN